MKDFFGCCVVEVWSRGKWELVEMLVYVRYDGFLDWGGNRGDLKKSMNLFLILEVEFVGFGCWVGMRGNVKEDLGFLNDYLRFWYLILICGFFFLYY